MGHFRTKARAIELLGKKQIRDSITGLSEIMKNSFDADAEVLRVEINTNISSPYILIYDTGCGMDAADIENKWLVLGTESKKVNKKERTPMGRTLMGEKGIGRLAVSKLGQQTIMLSKTKKSRWNILFFNWNIFENPHLMIENVLVPFKYNFDISDIDEVIKELIQIQKSNLQNHAWNHKEYAELFQVILNQINDLRIPNDIIYDTCTFIEDYKNQGTILLSFDLNDNWDMFLSEHKDSNKDLMTNKNYDRLASFISDFQNADNNLLVEFFYNGQVKEFNYNYSSEDYEFYDLKIEGVIEKGKFFGQLKARNADFRLLEECNRELEKGLEVTSGLSDWEKYDCGKFSIKLCHVELLRKNSGLTPDEYERIKNKMAVSGGVAVYRDNVRILPYGEVENDFLGMEKRRTLSAGEYIFSHRNMFGRIDISTENNPLLEDKSSREGLIENQSYFYFLTTLQNLLIRIAKEYITDALKDSKNLRKSYVTYNSKLAKEKEHNEKIEKEEMKRLLLYKNNLIELLDENEKKFSIMQNDLNNEIMNLSKEFSLANEFNYNGLRNLLNILHNKTTILKKKIMSINTLLIDIDIRYKASIKLKFIESIEDFNNIVIDYSIYIEKELDDTTNLIEKRINLAIEDWINKASNNISGTPMYYLKNIQDEIKQAKNRIYEFEFNIKDFYSQRKKETMSKIYFLDNIQNRIDDIETIIINKEFKDYLKKVENEYRELELKCNKLLDSEPNDLAVFGKNILNLAIKQQSEIENCYFNTIRAIENQFNQINKKCDLLAYFAEDENSQDTNNLIGLLKKKNIELENQLEIYSELANLGLSTEIVNHEFNQLFTNVFDAMKQLRYEPLNEDSKFLLKQIEIGFRAISDRQSQLSPMYRSRNLKKRSVCLHDLINDLILFFKEKLDIGNIVCLNEIDTNVNVVLSTSKIYPVLSNLLYNSIYWVADRKQKNIVFHFIEEENSLYIEDSGPGIPSKYLEKIFDPFFSLRPNGRGLGLTIAKKVLESQGQRIDAISEGNNKLLEGACFRIKFTEVVK